MTTTPTPIDQVVSWGGFHNTHDIGGLPTRDGRTTRFGGHIRAAGVSARAITTVRARLVG